MSRDADPVWPSSWDLETTGFNWRQNNTGQNRVSVAGHCGSSQSVMGTSVSFVTEYFSGAGDIQWHDSSAFTETNQIFVQT